MEPKKSEDKAKSLFSEGTRVSVKTANQSGLLGSIRYYGPMTGSTGSWVGVELDSALGKCNGSQGGKTYFSCKNNYGIFVRSTQVKIIEEEQQSLTRSQTKKTEDLSKTEDDDSKTREEVKQRIAEKKQKIVDQIKKDHKEDTHRTEDSNAELSLLKKEETIKLLEEDNHKLRNEIERAKKMMSHDSSLIADLKTKIATLEQQLKAKAVSADTQELIETLTLEKELAEENAETLQQELLRVEKEITDLREDLELKTLELEQYQDDAQRAALSEDNESFNVSELKIALKRLYNESQSQKVMYENRIQVLENQLADIPSVEAKIRQIGELKLELVGKQKEIMNLKDALEETSEQAEAVERLTGENFEKHEKILELSERLKELQELYDLEVQMAEEQADLEKTLNADIHDREVTIQNLKNELTKMEMQKVDYEKTINQFRVRVCELQNDVQSLKDQLADSGEEEKVKKMQQLMEKNVMINNKMREMMTMHINGKLNEVLYSSLQNKILYMEACIPSNVVDLLEMPILNNYLLLSTLRGKTYILLSEVIRITIDTIHDKYLLRWVANLGALCVNLIYDCLGLEDHLKTLSYKDYLDFMKAIDWGQFLSINSNVDNFLKLLKEGGISSTISLDTFNYSVGIVHHFSIQAVQNFSGKAALSRACLQLSVGIYCLLQMYGLNDSITGAVDYKELLHKSLTYGKLFLELGGEEDPVPLKNMAEVFSSRYSAVSKLLFDNEVGDYSGYSWVDWFTSSEKDIKSFLNFSIVKRQEERKNSGPWTVQALTVKEKLNKFEETNRDLEDARNNLKTFSLKVAKLEKELSELRISKTGLESRLADAHAKSTRLAQLEIEKKRLQDREKYFEESMDAVNTELEKYQERNKELEEELASLRVKEEDTKTQPSASMIAAESGGLINMLRGSTITRHGGGQIGQDELETFSAIIDHYKLQKKQMHSHILRSQIRDIPKFENLDLNPAKNKIDSLYKVQSQMKKDISKLRIVDLSDKNCKERSEKEKENLRANTLAARQTVEGIQNLVSGDGGMGSFIHTGPTGTLGKVVMGKGNNVIPACITLDEFRSLRKVLNLN
jgi:predicted  nucleic acid-binding Zn-ribbon protein